MKHKLNFDLGLVMRERLDIRLIMTDGMHEFVFFNDEARNILMYIDNKNRTKEVIKAIQTYNKLQKKRLEHNIKVVN